MTMEIDNIIKDYVNAKDTDYAIMIDGEWGARKSWYWNNVLTEIDKQMIEKVSLGEVYIHSLGFNTARVRYHDKIARIEASESHIKEIINNDEIRLKIVSYLKSLGFLFVCMDLEEYKTGSMNMLIQE